MLLRRLAPLAVLVAVGVLSTGCADQSAAVQVGDRTYSDADFQEDLEAVAGSETLFSIYENVLAQQQIPMPEAEGDAQGSYSQEFVEVMLNRRISLLLLEQVLDEEGVEIPDSDRDAVREEFESLFAEAGEKVSDVPKAVRDRVVDEFAGLQALQSSGISEETVQTFVDEMLQQVDVNSRYGEWDGDQLLVAPPAGPLVQGDDAADEQLQIPPG